ncbi:hypothetical protein P4O66_016821, partial [Electrophorus voltai]
MKKIGNVNLLCSPPGNPTFMQLCLGGTVIVQTCSKPLKNTNTTTFYIFMSSTSSVEHFLYFIGGGYMLTLNSLDKRVASVRMVPGPAVVAEAEGQALLLRAELAICDTCQKSKRKSALATGTGNVRVKFLSAEQRGGVRRRTWAGARGLADHGTCIEPVDIIAFLLNCATHSARSRSKNPPEQCQGPDQNRHQWVCLGIAAEQDRAEPIATTYKQQVPSTAEMPRGMEKQRPTERPRATEMPKQKTCLQYQQKEPGLTKIDIRHLAVLKWNGLEFSWMSQAAKEAT